MKSNGKILGILGGMGPAATAEFMRLVTELSPAICDQEHPEIYIYSHPIIPDRTSFILGEGEDPSSYIRQGLDKLVSWGADYLVATCNTAHHFIDEFRDELSVPLIHIVDETIKACAEVSSEGAWLIASTGTIQTGLYQKHAKESGYEFYVPTPEMQVRVQDVIETVKSGGLEDGGDKLTAIVEELWDIAELPIVGACTEIPIAYAYSDLDPEGEISSLSVLANACIKRLY